MAIQSQVFMDRPHEAGDDEIRFHRAAFTSAALTLSLYLFPKLLRT